MMKTWYRVIFIFSCFSIGFTNANNDTLESIVVVMRHGQRAPIKTYPTDPYKNMSYWPNGLGNLTEVGLRTQFQLGQWLGEKYRNLFGGTYSENNVFTLTNDHNRTVQSAKSTLLGIFSNTSTIREKMNEKLFKIDILIKKEDNIIACTKPCPKKEELLRNLLKSRPFFLSEEDEYILEYARNMSHFPVNDLVTAFYLHDTLETEKDTGLTIPNWSQPIYKKLEEKAMLHLLSNTYTEELARLQTGPLWNKIISFFKNVVNSKKSQRVFLISGHEYTLVNILNSIGTFHNQKPEVSSCLIFELRRNQRGYYLEIFFKNSTNFTRVTFKNCENQCGVQEVDNILKPLIVDQKQWHEECYSDDSSKMTFILCVIAGVVSLIVLLSVFLYRNRKNGDNEGYSPNKEASKFLEANETPKLMETERTIITVN